MLRIYLSGRLTIDSGETRVGPHDFPGQQGRAVFAMLVGEQGNPVARAAIVEALWPGGAPPSCNTAVSAIVSKLRGVLGRVGLDGVSALQASGGCYELRLPAGTWIDHEAAAASVHEAESALRLDDPARAYGPSAVAHHIARRPFLVEEGGRWFEARRDRLRSILVRALECRAEVYQWNGEYPLAAETAREILQVEPFRETGYQHLMRAHAAMGNAAEALLVYERCRDLIREELGVGPSERTRAVRAEVLAAT